jgi:Fe-S-cluster containining protein
MIIGKIDGISIHSSLLDKINLECIKAKCPSHQCCCAKVQLTKADIDKIQSVFPRIKSSLPPSLPPFMLLGDFYDSNHHINMLSSTEHPWTTCMFFQNNQCLLEKVEALPIQCKTFPLILENDILRISTEDLDCLKEGTTPAFKLLKREIIQLTDEVFYNKLNTLLSQPETQQKYLHYKMR